MARKPKKVSPVLAESIEEVVTTEATVAAEADSNVVVEGVPEVTPVPKLKKVTLVSGALVIAFSGFKGFVLSKNVPEYLNSEADAALLAELADQKRHGIRINIVDVE